MIDEIKKAVEVLKNGGIILYPTDTIWGLGCDATNPEAVEKIYKIKNRSETKSMIILLNNENFISRYVEQVPEVAYNLIEVTDKPLTIIYPEAKNLAENLIADDKSIAIRITNEEFSSRLLDYFRKPLVSTSANISGKQSPQNFYEISEQIKNSVDYIIDYNRNYEKKQPSSIIKLGLTGEIDIIRK